MSDRRNVAIGILSVALVVLLGVLLIERWPEESGEEAETDRQPVSVIDVVLDRDGLRALDLLFDRPLGEQRVGAVLAEAPAELEPRQGGTWRWHGANVLRFEPSERFTAATEYEIRLVPERLLAPDQELVGETSFRVITDQFQVDRVDVQEESLPEGRARVALRGTIHFNYPVEPEELAPLLRLSDPGGDPIPVGIETRYRTKDVAWRSDPVQKGVDERELRLTIDARLTSALGNVTLPAPFTHAIPLGSSERLVVRGVDGQPGEEESTLRVELSSPVSPARAEPLLAVEPQVDFALTRAGNSLVLRGPFPPGQTYTIRLGAGLTADDDARLAEEFTTRLHLPDLPVSVGFEGEGMFLSASGQRNLALRTVNVSRVALTVERVFRNNVLYLLEQRGYLVWSGQTGSGGVGHVYGDTLSESTIEIAGARNRAVRTPLHLKEYIDDASPGLYRIIAAKPDQRYGRAQRWVLITDLGIVAKQSRDGLGVFVSSFADLSPIAGARVRVLSARNQVVAETTTDAQGLAQLSGLAERLEGTRAALVVVETGDDWSFMPFEHTRVDTAGLDVGGAPAAKSGYDAYLYGQRDIYRPGETLEGLAVVRAVDLSTPPQMPLVLRHRDPQGQLAGDVRLDLGPGGVAEFAHDIPPYALTGGHTLELLAGEEAIGRYRFAVEEFVPDRIKVEIAPARPAVGLEQALEFDVSSAYLFGAPAGGLAVESRVRLEPAAFQPAGFEGFTFGNPDRSFQAREILAADATLDAEGRHAFSVEIPSGVRVPASLRALITARVQEQGGRGVSARDAVAVHPYPYYLGVRRSAEGYVEPGAPVEIEFVAVAPAGGESPTGTLRAELYRDRWQTVLRRTRSGTYRYESNRDPQLLESRLIESGASRGSLELTPPEFGSYRVVLTDEASGASAQVGFYASGWGFAPWAIENPGRVEIDLDAEDYEIGETASVAVRSPFPGALLLTVERDGVMHREVHRLEGNTASLKLPVREAYRPNVYVTATVVRAAGQLEPGSPGRAFGAVPLFVDRERHRLPLRVGAPEVIRPRGPLEIEVQAAPGTRLTVAAVDEGILQLIAQQNPDPFGHFYRKRALEVGTFDTFSLLLPEVGVEGAAPVGGGVEGLRAKMAQFVGSAGIRRAEPVAFWSGLREVDPTGKLRVAFDVPDFQGALRVMAVGLEERSFGAAHTQVRVRDPVIVLPTFPRFLSFGERLELPVTVRNDTGERGSFRVTLATEGPVSLEGADAASVELADGSEQTVYFTLATGETSSPVELALEASGNGETTRASGSLGLRPDLPAVTRSEAGQITEPSWTPRAEATETLRPEGRSRQLRLSPVPLVQLSGKLEQLVRYPYGCLEQTVSRVFPLLYVADLAAELEPELFREHDPDGLVVEGIRRVATLRLPSGGFALWPNGGAPDLWGSIYATHFLVEARRAGHEIPGTLLDDALGFVAGEARPRRSYSGGALERAVYALYVLARAGRADVATMDFVREQHRGALRPSARAQLAAAYAANGDADAVRELLEGLDDAEAIRRQTGGNFDSTTRNRALVLLALLDAVPDDPRIGQLADRLARDAALERYWSTQETALALLALGQLFARQADRTPYSGTLLVGGEEVASFGSDTVVLRDLPWGPLEVAMAPGYEPGAAFYSLETRGIPTDESFAPSADGLELERALRTRDGKELGPDGIRQGDLVVLWLRIRSTGGRLENVAVAQLLPAGLEIENPRLQTSESLPGLRSTLQLDHVDVRDDRLLLFVGLPDEKWQTYHALLRAVTPGTFRLPPIQAEAMYDPTLRVTGERGTLQVRRRP